MSSDRKFNAEWHDTFNPVVLHLFWPADHLFNIFMSRLIQAVHTKTAGSHVALHRNFSGPVSATDPVKSSKDAASLAVCTRKKNFW